MRKQHPELTGLPSPPPSGGSLVTGGEGEGDAGAVTEPRGSDDPPGAKAFVCTFPSAQGEDLQAKSSGQRVSDSHRCCFFQGPSPFSLSVNSAHRHSRHHLQPPAYRSITRQQTQWAGKHSSCKTNVKDRITRVAGIRSSVFLQGLHRGPSCVPPVRAGEVTPHPGGSGRECGRKGPHREDEAKGRHQRGSSSSTAGALGKRGNVDAETQVEER